MGLFDFLKRKPPAASKPDAPSSQPSSPESASAAAKPDLGTISGATPFPGGPIGPIGPIDPTKPTDPDPPAGPTPMPLDSVLGSILIAVTDAQKLANEYASGLYSSTAPSSTPSQIPQAHIETMRVNLRMAIHDSPALRMAGPEQPQSSPPMVLVDAAHLSTMPEQSITELSFDIHLTETDAAIESNVSF